MNNKKYFKVCKRWQKILNFSPTNNKTLKTEIVIYIYIYIYIYIKSCFIKRTYRPQKDEYNEINKKLVK